LAAGRYEEALACLHESLDIRQDLAERLDRTRCMADLAIIYQRQGREAAAVVCLRESLTICQELGARDSQADSRCDLGVVCQRQGRHQQALDYLRESLAIRRELGDAHGEAETLQELGVTMRALGRTEEARAHWLEAQAIFERLQTTDADQVRDLLADLSHNEAQDGRRNRPGRMPRLRDPLGQGAEGRRGRRRAQEGSRHPAVPARSSEAVI
jgi:tetratricopeptide (TPR) repeat protein